MKDIKYLIIKFYNVLIVDQSGAYAIEDAIEQLEKRNVKVFFVGMTMQIKAALTKIGTVYKINDNYCFNSFEDALLNIDVFEKKLTSVV